MLNSAPTERWPSGRRRTPGKCVYGNVSRVRIPPSPPFLNCGKFNNFSKNLKNQSLCGLRHCWGIKGIFMTTRATSSFLTALLISLAACEADDVSPLVDEKIGTNLTSKATWNLSDGSEYPRGRILSRAEDGVMFGDGSLMVADQRYGLVNVTAVGTIEQFGDFKSVGYRHDPPKIEAAPNGVDLTPDGLDILTADVFTGHIYRTSVTTGNIEIAYSHPYGVNTAIEDST